MAKAKDDTPKSFTDLVLAQAKIMQPNKKLLESAFKVQEPRIRNWISTGSPIVDYLIGQKPEKLGLPGGRVIDIIGENACGKSGFALECIAAAQQAGGRGMVVASEPLDGDYAEQTCGVNISDPDKFLYAEATSLEGAGTLLESAVLANKNSTVPVVLLWDSVSGCGSRGEMLEEKDTHDGVSAAAGAKFLHQFFRRGILTHMSGTNIVLICIRHLTASPRAFDGDKATHGSALDFHASLRLKIHKKKMEKEDNEYVGDWRVIRCLKSKVGVAHWIHEQPVYHGVGRDPQKEMFQFLKNHKAIEQRGAYYQIQNESLYEWQWLERIRDDPNWRTYFSQWVLNVLKGVY